MAFWGVEVKPSKPYSHHLDRARGRLRISQATLGNGTSLKKSLVQCNVEDKSSVLICCLLPDKTESCSLDLEFQEEDKVTFSVLGPRSVHLAGYYLYAPPPNTGDDSGSYGEDIGDTDTEHSTDIQSQEDEYEDDFIDDADLQTFSPPAPKTKNEHAAASEDEGQTQRKGNHKRLKKRYQVSDSDGDNRNENIIGGGSSIFISGSEDEDALPISSLSKMKVESAEVRVKPDATTVKKNKEKHEHGVDQATGSKSTSQDVQDDETERAFESPKYVSMPSSEIDKENGEKPKKKREKAKSEGRESRGVGNDSVILVQQDKAEIEETKANDCSEEHISNEKDEQPSRAFENPKYVSTPSFEVGKENGEKRRKKRKKEKSEGRESRGVGNDSVILAGQDKAQIEETKANDCSEEYISTEKDEKPSSSLDPDADHVEEDAGEKKKKRKKKKRTSDCEETKRNNGRVAGRKGGDAKCDVGGEP